MESTPLQVTYRAIFTKCFWPNRPQSVHSPMSLPVTPCWRASISASTSRGRSEDLVERRHCRADASGSMRPEAPEVSWPTFAELARPRRLPRISMMGSFRNTTSCVNGAAGFRTDQCLNIADGCLPQPPMPPIVASAGPIRTKQRFDECQTQKAPSVLVRPVNRQDPLTGFFIAMRDAWLAGAGPQGYSDCVIHRRRQSRMPYLRLQVYWDPMIGMLGAMADLAAANRQRFDPHADADGAIGSPPGGQESSVPPISCCQWAMP